MRMRSKGFPIVPVMTALALAMMLPAGAALAQTAPAGVGMSGSTDRSAASPERSQDELAGKLVRRVIQRAPLSVPGREMVQVETEIPPGVESGWHVHPGEEVGYIIAGQVEMMVQGRANVILNPGDGFLIPPATPHNARDIGPETGRMLSTYIVEIGQPIATFVDQHAHK
jgi:quercetin dioxygenase-like cupin family protein